MPQLGAFPWTHRGPVGVASSPYRRDQQAAVSSRDRHPVEAEAGAVCLRNDSPDLRATPHTPHPPLGVGGGKGKGRERHKPRLLCPTPADSRRNSQRAYSGEGLVPVLESDRECTGLLTAAVIVINCEIPHVYIWGSVA